MSCDKLCMNMVAATFFPASRKGVILYEPFGGLCAGLEMILRCAIPVTPRTIRPHRGLRGVYRHSVPKFRARPLSGLRHLQEGLRFEGEGLAFME